VERYVVSDQERPRWDAIVRALHALGPEVVAEHVVEGFGGDVKSARAWLLDVDLALADLTRRRERST
jgi:hypothetical protein